MIDTNQLLSIGFALISNFNCVIHLPPDRVPLHPEDVQKFTVGSPHSPLDLWVVTKKGEEFWIREGIVHAYQSPDTYFHVQELENIPRLEGSQIINSNQIVSLATNILAKLTKFGNPLQNITPSVETTSNTNFPFYSIRWPVSESWTDLPAAAMEIDARTGRAVSVRLWSPEFYDLAFAQDISNRVFRPDPPNYSAPTDTLRAPKRPPMVTTNQVERLVPRWLEFCRRLDLHPGIQTNVSDVEWSETFYMPSPPGLPAGTLYKIQFKDGTIFESVDDKVFVHVSSDASFAGAWADKSPEYWKPFVGPATNSWQELAIKFGTFLLERTRAPAEWLSKWTPAPYARGVGGVSRCRVNWYDNRYFGKKPQDSVDYAFGVEFDLKTGLVKSLNFHDFSLLGWEREPASGNR